VRSWYLPLALIVMLLRAGARRDTRRALSLALVLLGLGALAARAFDARSSMLFGAEPGQRVDASTRACSRWAAPA
jgi:hypothetical protein